MNLKQALAESKEVVIEARISPELKKLASQIKKMKLKGDDLEDQIAVDLEMLDYDDDEFESAFETILKLVK